MTGTERMSDAEFRNFLILLRRFIETELDQFANWRFDTSSGEIYITVGRELLPETEVDAYYDLTHILDST